MKFLSGFITGILTTVGLLALYVKSEWNETQPGLTLFPEKGACITHTELEVFQTLEPTMALAKFYESSDVTLVLLVNDGNTYYYDGQKITIPANKCARQLGIYQYETNMDVLKTVPVVAVE